MKKKRMKDPLKFVLKKLLMFQVPLGNAFLALKKNHTSSSILVIVGHAIITNQNCKLVPQGQTVIPI